MLDSIRKKKIEFLIQFTLNLASLFFFLKKFFILSAADDILIEFFFPLILGLYSWCMFNWQF